MRPTALVACLAMVMLGAVRGEVAVLTMCLLWCDCLQHVVMAEDDGGAADPYTVDYCDVCNHYKPPRTHHCSQCDRCVMRLDHHCAFMNTCIGIYNWKFFILFVGYRCGIRFLLKCSQAH